MSDKIQLGKIAIHDVNKDDFFDPKVDRVTTAAGKSLSEAEKTRELGKVLKELDVDNWQGILLSRAAVYLQQMSLARELALRVKWKRFERP